MSDTRTPEAYHRAAAWLNNCLDDHACGSANSTDWLPHRVLGLRARVGKDADCKVVRLVENPPEKHPYAALSYCWGSDLSGVVTTLSSNVEPHLQGIAVNSLPQTIQDAVRVYRELGLRHLWVDSLCIIQDDRKDWAQKVDRMRKVYQFSRVTIATHSAASCKEGFLGPQQS